MEENSDMRNMLLSELIDKMHNRMADKMFPAETAEKPVEMGSSPEAAEMEEPVAPESEAEEPSDDEITELLGE